MDFQSWSELLYDEQGCQIAEKMQQEKSWIGKWSPHNEKAVLLNPERPLSAYRHLQVVNWNTIQVIK